MKLTFLCKSVALGDELAIAYNDRLSSVVYRPKGVSFFSTLTPYALKDETIAQYGYYLHYFKKGRLHQIFQQPTQLQG